MVQLFDILLVGSVPLEFRPPAYFIAYSTGHHKVDSGGRKLAPLFVYSLSTVTMRMLRVVRLFTIRMPEVCTVCFLKALSSMANGNRKAAVCQYRVNVSNEDFARVVFAFGGPSGILRPPSEHRDREKHQAQEGCYHASGGGVGS